ncbi:MAG: hypothetical protein ACYC46_15950 [Acidobacteriaceae bacterium]
MRPLRLPWWWRWRWWLVGPASALAGCAGTTPPRTVDIPVYSCPTVTIPAKPFMPITGVTASTPPSAAIRALVESFAAMTGDDAQVRTLLEPYGHH